MPVIPPPITRIEVLIEESNLGKESISTSCDQIDSFRANIHQFAY